MNINNTHTAHTHQSPPPSPSSSSFSFVLSNSTPSRPHPPRLVSGSYRPNSHYHSDPIPSPPPHQPVQSITSVSSLNNANLHNKHTLQSPTRTNSISSATPHLPRTNSGMDTPIQFNTSEIERSFQALLKKQPVATPGPTVLQGKGINSHSARRDLLHPQDKPDFLHSGSLSSSSKQRHQPQQLSGNVGALSHSPVFGSPATDHARHWIRSVNAGRDYLSDSESEQRESDQDLLEDSHQQWQIDYDHHIAGHVELETENIRTESVSQAIVSSVNPTEGIVSISTQKLQAPSGPSPSSWTGNVHPMFSMAGECSFERRIDQNIH